MTPNHLSLTKKESINIDRRSFVFFKIFSERLVAFGVGSTDEQCLHSDLHFYFFLNIYIFISVQQQEQDPTNLYISNLPVSMDEQELENMLKSFGQVISTRILRDANGTSRGVGFARWECHPLM